MSVKGEKKKCCILRKIGLLVTQGEEEKVGAVNFGVQINKKQTKRAAQ